ncbi:MAG: hypothetical protein LUD17_16150 [Bacteroidales bacterium]|nr:hypothetical protein [Bacteroidales bacterium]
MACFLTWLLFSCSISAIRGVPVLVVGDPLDGHSPVATYRQLVDDAHSLGIPLTLRLRSYAGMDYNVFLSGPETFQFYLNPTALFGTINLILHILTIKLVPYN